MTHHTDTLSHEERLSEVAAIIALGIIRLRMRHKEQSQKERRSGEISLDLAPRRSVYVTVTKTEKHYE